MNARTQQLLDAAAAIAARGAQISISAVAAEAGVSRATAHRHLGGRSGLLALLAERSGVDLPERTRADPRTRILDAVGAFVRECGFIGVSLEDVARRAEVGPATLYRKFGDRAGLVRAYANERGPTATLLSFDLEGSLRSQLITLVQQAIPFLREHRGLLALLFSNASEERALVQTMLHDPTSGRRAMIRFFASAMARGHMQPGDPQIAAYTLLGAVASVSLALHDQTAEQLAPTLVDDFLQGHATKEE